MPGFPIRTSSDQRFIDNSPRLNAALHVLHRLSMPRHPPCALNNEHTTNHTQQQCQKHHHHVCGRRELHKTQKNRNHTNHTPTTNQQTSVKAVASMQFNARVHYTVLTQHPTPQPPPSNKASTVCYQHGLQPGDNAPDTQQCTNIQKKKSNLRRLDKLRLWLRCISTRLKKVAAEHASTSTTTTTTHPQKERGFRWLNTNWCQKNNAP